MKNIILICLMMLFTSIGVVMADTTKVSSTTLEYSHSNIKFDVGFKSNFDGAVIGFGSDPRERYGYWGKLEISQNNKSKSEYYEGTVGLHYNLLNKDDFYLNGLAGIGYTRIDSGITSSNLNFISVPVGIEAGYSLAKNLDLFANVGYKWMFDMTGNKGYFDNGKISIGSNNTSLDKYKDKVLCRIGSVWFNGTASSLCDEYGGVVANERDKTLCKDGTWRDGAINSGTCTASGGILEDDIKNGSLIGLQEKYGNSISFGDAETPVYKIGLRFRF
jgi:hypothetical protein